MRRSIRVIHVTSSLTSIGGGVREVVFHLADHQSRLASLDVSVVGLEEHLWSTEKSSWEAIPTYAHKVIGPRSFGYSNNLVDCLVRLNPDLIHLHGLWMYPSKAVLAWHNQTKRPYIISTHGMLSSIALSYSAFKKQIVGLWFHNAVLRTASALHSTSDSETLEIANFGLTNKVFQVPNGVVIPKLANFDMRIPKKVVTLGRIHKKKGLSLLLRAWLLLESRFPDWCLEIIGPDEDGELTRLQLLAKELDLQRVTFLGPVFGRDKLNAFQSASIFVLPSLSENFALTVAESLACGVPVVSTKGAPWELLEIFKCGRWVDINVEALSNGLKDMMMLSPYELSCMGKRGRNLMQERFSWASVSSEFEGIYSHIIHNVNDD